MRPRLWICPVFAVLAAAGCKKSDEGGGKAVEPPDLQLVSKGNEPRRDLTYKVAKGTKRSFDVAVDFTLEAGDMGGPLPTVAMTLDVAVEDVAPDGSMKLHTTIVDATARERLESKVPAEALSGPLEPLKGIALASTLTPKGRMSKAVVEGGKQLSDAVNGQLASLTASLQDVMMTLPIEPVGVGAVWRSSRPIEQNQLKLTAVNTVTLLAIDGDKIGYSLDTEIHGDDQKVTMEGQTLEVKDITGTGAGKGTLSLTTLEVTSDLSAELRSKMQATGESEGTPMKMTLQTKIESH
ncbi:MAG: hypothetical protein HOV81_08775 [Kofleriaceae bacterium]|nr:hypothetical protein [Kofleriaceae bacterium]